MIDLHDRVPYGYRVYGQFYVPSRLMKGGSFFKKLIKHGRKFVKDIPMHIDTYNQIRDKAENAYDQYNQVKEQMPDFVTQNKHVQKLTSGIEKVADHSRKTRDHTDKLISAVQPLISSTTPLEGQGLKLAGKQYGGSSRGRASADQDRADPMANLRQQLIAQEKKTQKLTTAVQPSRGAVLSRVMTECNLSPSERKHVKDYCKKHPKMSMAQVATLPFMVTENRPELNKIRKVQKQIEQSGSGKQKPLRTVGEVVKILTPLLALI